MGICKCELSFGNTGQSDCPTLQRHKVLDFFIPRYDSTGARNKVDVTATIDAAFLTARLNDVDKTKRWYPVRDIKNAAPEQAEDIIQTFEDQTTNLVSEGLISDTYLINKGTPVLIGKLKQFRCQEFGILSVDANGTLIGDGVFEAGFLHPFEVDSNSLSIRFVKPTPSIFQGIQVSFNYASSAKDENIRMLIGDNVTANFLGAKGLIDVTAIITSISTTGFTAKLITDQGPVNDLVTVDGLVSADFVSSVTATVSTIRNVTDSSDVSIVSVTESPDGTYTFAFVAQTAADVLKLKPVKNGFDFSLVEAETITIP